MHKQPTRPTSSVPPHLVARQVEGGFWMLYNVYYGQLLDDYGWFQSRAEAEAKIAEVQRVATPTRFFSRGPDAGALN
jgi:hypothetical protein